MVEVTLERVYNGKIIVNSTVKCVTDIFQFTMVKFTLLISMATAERTKIDPSPITIGITKKNRWVYL